MNDNKIKKLVVAKQNIVNKLTDSLPKKHAHRAAEYKAFLQNELRLINLKLESLKG